jgi:hypothetical protein
MADHVVGHHPTMPGVGKAVQAVVATRHFEDSLHASIINSRSLYVFHRLRQKNMRTVTSVTAFSIREEYSAMVDG